jgi:hypothetical protein
MNHQTASLSPLALEISHVEAKLCRLEQEVAEIGQPAGHALQLRLDALKIEDHALKRNFEEARRLPQLDSAKMLKIERLLHHIEREERSVEQEAHFLQQAAPSSVTLTIQTGAHVVDLVSRSVKRLLGAHQPLGRSVFVNHSSAEISAAEERR